MIRIRTSSVTLGAAQAVLPPDDAGEDGVVLDVDENLAPGQFEADECSNEEHALALCERMADLVSGRG